MTTEANLNEMVEKLSGLKVLELAKLKTLLEEKWGVTAAAPVAVAAAGGGGATAAVQAESTEFQVSLTDCPADKKLGVIKVIREVTGLGLKEAMTLVAELPKVIKEKASKAEAEELVKKVEAGGGKAIFKGL